MTKDLILCVLKCCKLNLIKFSIHVKDQSLAKGFESFLLAKFSIPDELRATFEKSCRYIMEEMFGPALNRAILQEHIL